jgi:hypothetical protein
VLRARAGEGRGEGTGGRLRRLGAGARTAGGCAGLARGRLAGCGARLSGGGRGCAGRWTASSCAGRRLGWEAAAAGLGARERTQRERLGEESERIG